MSVTAERFAQGLTYEEFKAVMTKNREKLESNERGLDLHAEDLAVFKSLPETFNVLAIGEDWCTDVIDNLPIVARIAAESGKLNLRVFLRDQNLDLMDQFLKEGKHRSIPSIVFFDDQFNEIGRFIE